MAESVQTQEVVIHMPTHDPADVEENKDLAALSYAWIMAVVLLLFKKHSPFVHFHAKQGTVLFILSVIVWFIPYANRGLELLVFLLMVWTELPFVGPLARGKFTFRGSWMQTVTAIVNAKKWVVDLWKHHDNKNELSPSSPHQDIPPVDPTSKL
jgi:uncharacterized membrane protein